VTASAQTVVAKGLDYLREIELTQTYVVSLQTAVFCRSKRMKDRELIQRNVDWLLAARCRVSGGPLLGWTYTRSNSRTADNSNTQFAVLALDAGQDAGAKVHKKDWQEIRDYYLRTQQADGGWAYNPSVRSGSTFTMTSAGVCGLLIARKQLKQADENLDKAMARGLEFLGEHFTVEPQRSQYYHLYGLARAGRLAEKKNVLNLAAEKSYDWYRLGAQWLLDKQAEDGSWKIEADFNPEIATSFALLFLAKDK
jgi:hypothetical protein